MVEKILSNIFMSPTGGFATVVAIILAVIWACTKVAVLSTLFYANNNDMQSLKKEIHEINGSLKYLTEKINDISNRIKIVEDDRFAKSNSPISLTIEGQKVADELNVKEMLANHWTDIERILDEKCVGSNPYDVQQLCFAFASDELYKMFTDEEMAKIKIIAYNKGANIDNFEIIFGVEIRDEYMRRRGIDAGLIDKHDPGKN